MAIRQLAEAHQDGREAAHRGVREAPQGCCPGPESPSALVSLSAQVRSPERAQRGAPPARRASLWAPARDVPEEPLRAVAASELDELRVEPEAVASVRAAEEPQTEAARAAAEPRPEAATAASERQGVAAAEEPDVPQAGAAGAEPGVPQGAVGAAAELGATARRLAEAERAGGVVQPRAGVRPGARAPQAVQPLAVPSEAASVFRQGPSLAAGPARPQAAVRFAHAMRSLRIASRSEPSWQAARSEGWSCDEIPRKVL